MIKCPTLVLCRREDQATPLSMHEDMAGAISDSRLVVVEQCGHLSTMEKPEEVNAALQTPAVRQKLLDLNVEPHPSTVVQAHDWLETEIKRWGDVIQRAGIQKQ